MTMLNQGFDTYHLMDRYNDTRAMLRRMTFSEEHPSFYLLNVCETHYPYALPDEPPEQWPRVSGVHGVFQRLDQHIVGGKLMRSRAKVFNDAKLKQLRHRQIDAVKYLDGVVEELFDLLPPDTYVTVTSALG